MSEAETACQNYRRISMAIKYLVDNQCSQPTLAELSCAVDISEYHLQRMFSAWAGVSPKRFLQYLTKEKAKQCLQGHSVFEAALSSGLSGGGRLHDLMVGCESVTPGEYKSAGAGLEIFYGIHPSRFGHCFVASTSRGICKLAFFDSLEERGQLFTELVSEWPNARIAEDRLTTATQLAQVFAEMPSASAKLGVLLKGTPFQMQVWEALLRIPQGAMVSYQQLADGLGRPSSVRAVASAVARNNIGYLIPCHRVIRATGALNNYRWGEERKAAMLGWEAARSDPSRLAIEL